MSAVRPRGCRPTPRHKLAGATPHRPSGPTPAQFAVIPSKLSMWLNDVKGDCVTAEEAFAKACAAIMAGLSELFIQDATVMSWANAHGVLNGAELLEVLQWMAQGGFSQDGTTYNDGAATAVDWTNAATLRNAISQGPVKLGVVGDPLESIVGSVNGWCATGIPQQNVAADEDHCVGLCGYGTLSWLTQQLGVSVPAGMDGTQPGYLLFTWSTIGVIDVPSLLAITGEAWLRNPTTVIVGPTPAPTPAPVPPAPAPVPPAPTPTPLPPPTIQQEVDSLFALLEMQSAGSPWLVAVEKLLNSYIDSLFASHAGGLHTTSRHGADGTKGAIPPLIIQLIDQGFLTAEKAYPQYAPYLKLVQQWVDAWLPLLWNEVRMVALLFALLPLAEPIAPPRPAVTLRDLDPFPAHWVANANWHFAVAHVDWLEVQAGFDPSLVFDPAFTDWLAEARALRNLWDDVDRATGPDFSLEFRLSCLSCVRDRLTAEEYRGGRCPPPVPVWRFRRIP